MSTEVSLEAVGAAEDDVNEQDMGDNNASGSNSYGERLVIIEGYQVDGASEELVDDKIDWDSPPPTQDRSYYDDVVEVRFNPHTQGETRIPPTIFEEHAGTDEEMEESDSEWVILENSVPQNTV